MVWREGLIQSSSSLIRSYYPRRSRIPAGIPIMSTVNNVFWLSPVVGSLPAPFLKPWLTHVHNVTCANAGRDYSGATASDFHRLPSAPRGKLVIRQRTVNSTDPSGMRRDRQPEKQISSEPGSTGIPPTILRAVFGYSRRTGHSGGGTQRYAPRFVFGLALYKPVRKHMQIAPTLSKDLLATLAHSFNSLTRKWVNTE